MTTECFSYAYWAARSSPPWVDWTVTVLLFVAGIAHLSVAYLGKASGARRSLLFFRTILGLGMIGISLPWVQKLIERGDLLTLYSTQFGVLMMAFGALGVGVLQHFSERQVLRTRACVEALILEDPL